MSCDDKEESQWSNGVNSEAGESRMWAIMAGEGEFSVGTIENK